MLEGKLKKSRPMIFFLVKNKTQRDFCDIFACTPLKKEGKKLKLFPREFIHNHVTRDSDC